jgi:DNA primase
MIKTRDFELLDTLRSLGIRVHDSTKRNVQCFCHKNDEKSPSFFFELDTEKYKCFSCGLRGHGINNLIFELTGKEVKEVSFLNRITFGKEAHEITPKIPLLPLAIGNKGQVYLNARGFTTDSIKKWNLQYWSEEHGIIIPIKNVGYILRWIVPIDPKMKYKYIHGTKMDSTVFGIEHYNHKIPYSILVEGSLDAIWLDQLGFHNSLAILHTDISQKQLKLLRGATCIIYLCLDSDSPGIAASEKLIPMLKRYFIVKRMTLPEGKDPNDCTKEEIKYAFDNAVRR